VTGTLRPGGKQQKEVFGTLEAAASCRDSWESVRVSNQAALRARATRLTQAELTSAEAAPEMIRGTGFNLAEVVRLFLLNPLNKPTEKVTLAKAGLEFRAFLSTEVKAKTMSSAQEENLRIAQQSFTQFCGEKQHVHEVNGGQIEAWLRSKQPSVPSVSSPDRAKSPGNNFPQSASRTPTPSLWTEISGTPTGATVSSLGAEKEAGAQIHLVGAFPISQGPHEPL
jgi:hypothetical protein